MNARVVGSRAKRIEDPALLRGIGRFLDDVPCAGVVHAAFVRSPHAHAAIRGMDLAAVRAMPGVVAAFAASDIAGVLTAPQMPPHFPSDVIPRESGPFPLAVGEACYVGEPVAIIIAESRYVAEDAANALEVDYAPLAAVVDTRAAVKSESPKMRSGLATNVVHKFKVAYGDAKQAFAGAPHVFRVKAWQHRGVAHSIETRGILVQPDLTTGGLTVWASCQLSHQLQAMMVDMLGVAEDAIRVIAPDVGGGFGTKYAAYPEDITIAAVAKMLGRPIKWVEDRREHFLAATQERDQFWEMEIAVDAAGKILGVRGTMIHDHGAYTYQGTHVAYNAAVSLTGPYVVPHYEIDVECARTNKVPVLPVRGAGYPQAAFMMERLIDKAARGLGIDRAELRARNLIPTEKMPYPKRVKNRAGAELTIDSGNYPKCQAEGIAAIDYAGFPARQKAARAAGRYIGLGIAHAVKPTGRGPFESARVRVASNGKVSVYTGALAMGQGLKTSLAQICAEQLAVPLEAIEVTTGDTAFVSGGLGGFASRQAIMAGSAVHVASQAVVEKAKRVASTLLEAAPEDLELKDGRVVIKGVEGRGITIGEIARKLRGSPGFMLPPGVDPSLEATSNFQLDVQAFANAFHACEVEVDPGTGHVAILRYVAVQDSGRLINPLIAEGQVHGGIAHGIGNALFEWMRYDDAGQPITTTLADYLLPTTTETPSFEVHFVESPSPLNPLGVKGIGEAATIPVAPAVIAAVEDALAPFGVEIAEAPILPIRIVELIRSKR